MDSPRGSCLTHLINNYDYVTGLGEKARTVNIVYLSFSKAFDTVPYIFLTERLLLCGLDEVRFENYLNG